MSWRAITENDVITKIDNIELSTYRAAALQSGQSDPLTASITEITELVRGYVPSQRGSDGTVPTELIPSACDLIVCSFLGRVKAVLSQDRKDARNEAYRLLRDCVKGEFRIAAPDTYSNETATFPTPNIVEPSDVIGTYPKFGTKFDRSTQDGI